jgi:hypothetical protein
LVSTVILSTFVTVFNQWVQIRDTLLHKYGFICHKKKFWLPWLSKLTLDSPRLTVAEYASISEVWTSAILWGWSYGIKNYVTEVTFSVIILLLYFMVFHQLVQSSKC